MINIEPICLKIWCMHPNKSNSCEFWGSLDSKETIEHSRRPRVIIKIQWPRLQMHRYNGIVAQRYNNHCSYWRESEHHSSKFPLRTTVNLHKFNFLSSVSSLTNHVHISTSMKINQYVVDVILVALGASTIDNGCYMAYQIEISKFCVANNNYPSSIHILGSDKNCGRHLTHQPKYNLIY